MGVCLTKIASATVLVFLLIILSTSTQGFVVPVAQYGFNESSGSTTADSSGNGNTGVILQATRTTSGKYGRALLFDGVNDWVTVNDSPTLRPNTAITIEAWVYPTTAPKGWRSLVAKESVEDLSYYLHAGSRPNNFPAAGVNINGENDIFGTSRLVVNTWTHLAATYDGNVMRFYMNGTEVSSRIINGSINNYTNGTLRFGGNNIYGEFFKGRIDEVRIYNAALQPLEVARDMNTAVGAPLKDVLPPQVSITNPTDGQQVSGIVAITASAADDTAVSRVSFYDGAALVGTDAAAPFSVQWDTSALSGQHVLMAAAFDAQNNSANSTNVTVTVIDVMAPSVSATHSPASINQLSDVTITATASDASGIARIDIFTDSTGVMTCFNSTNCAYNSTFAVGTHTYYATATDVSLQANNGTSNTTNFTVMYFDNVAPSVSIMQPSESEVLAGVALIAINASDDVGVANVSIFVDGVQMALLSASPYEFSWNTSSTANGTHNITATATDASGNQASQSISVLVDNIIPDTTAPTVTITAPDNNDVVSGIVTITANASDDVGVAGVQFMLDGNNLGAEITIPPYVTTWNTTAYTNGTYNLTAIATDTSSNMNAHMIIVDVQNIPPDYDAPTINVTHSPLNPSDIDNVTVLAQASDVSGIARMQIFVDGNLARTCFGASACSYISNYSAGQHNYSAQANDLSANNNTASTSTAFFDVAHIDLTPPTVVITDPVDEQVVVGIVAITANASDDISLRGVTFLINGVALEPEDTIFPYTTAWNTSTVANGTYNVTATATDISGNQASQTITVSVDNVVPDTTAPMISVSHSPADPDTNATVNISATASDASGILQISIYADNASVMTCIGTTICEYASTFDAGTHTYYATATDNSSNQNVGRDPVNGTKTFSVSLPPDTTAPTTTITNPANNELISGIINIAANATDNVGVEGVQFLLDGNNLGAEDTTAPYSFTLDTVSLINGNHTVASIARDAAGNFGYSENVTVNVNNAPPFNMSGPLRVSAVNPLYFTDDTGRAVYLTGSHGWLELQDGGVSYPPTVLNYTVFLDFLQSYNHNFLKLWAWEQSNWVTEKVTDFYFLPNVYQRTGPGNATDGMPKFDVTQFNQAYFDRLRARVIEAGQRGMYVDIIFFNGWSIETREGFPQNNPWKGHPYNIANNINGVDADTNDDLNGEESHTLSNSTITALQEAYVRKVIDTVNDLDNVVYEISIESPPESMAWQYHMINYTKAYELNKSKQHVVGMSGDWWYSNDNLFASPADWIAPGAGISGNNYQVDPPANNGSKVIIADTDHLWGVGGGRDWVWKSFTRGIQTSFMDEYDGGYGWIDPYDQNDTQWVQPRSNMGYSLTYANKMNLINMTPQGNLSSTNYALASSNEYLIYNPSAGSVDVNLQATIGTLDVEWLNPATGIIYDGGTVSGGAVRTLTPPFSGDSVLYLNITGNDTTAPALTITTPNNNDVVSGTITVSANASDDVGVEGVQFLLDGNNLGAEDTTYPYSITWNTTTTANGDHNISAIARDASNNTGTATINVYVNNTIPSVNGTYVFPVRYSADSRYLVDQNGVPFPILGRTAWFIIALPVNDYQNFINNTASKGYNAIEMHVINHDPQANNAPFNGNGDIPFLRRLDGSDWNGNFGYGNINNDAPDFTTPNEAYWSYVDAFLNYTASRGIVVFFFPAYVGANGGSQGWMAEMTANGQSKMFTYGQWLATRYQNQSNLVWMMGGDYHPFSAPEIAAEQGLLDGINNVTDKQSIYFSAEWGTESIATDSDEFRSNMTLNGAYSWTGDVPNHARRAYSYSPVRPAFLLEEPYDEEGPDGSNYNPYATQPVRRFQWWGWLSTIGGYISGNGYIWRFNPGWESHMDTQGSSDMNRLNNFIQSIPWWELVPSGLNGMKNLIISGGGTVSGGNYVAAAATPTGTLLVAYIPPAHSGTITVDMTAMNGDAQARWLDPTTSNYTIISGSPFANTSTRIFTPPGNNAAGQGDWVLVLDTYSGPDIFPPSISVTHSPANPSSAQQVTYTATASDISGISNITISVDDSDVITCLSSPCIFVGGPYMPGNHTYYAGAFDASNNSNTGRDPATGTKNFNVIDASTNYTLTVISQGEGSGVVTSNPSGISCGSNCAAAFLFGTQVVLTPNASNGSLFAGWGGACSGTGTCTLTMDSDKSAIATFNNASAPVGLVLAYNFDEGAGTSVNDESGNGHTGTLVSGPTWTAGMHGMAVSLDGVNDHVTISPATGVIPIYTISMWINPSSSQASGIDCPLVTQSGTGLYYFVVTPPSQHLNMYNGATWQPSTSALTTDAWNYVAVTVNGSTVNFYLNGQHDGTRTLTGLNSLSFNNIGINSFNEAFHGLIDDLRIYNRTLSQAEIQADMNTGVGGVTGPTDTIPPSVTISSPSNGQDFNSSSITVSGTAADDVSVSAVRVRLNGGAWTDATGTNSWSIAENLVAGSNTINAQSFDTSSNPSAISNVTVTYTVQNQSYANYSDSFDRPNSDNLGSDWITVQGKNQLRIINNFVAGHNVFGAGTSYYNATFSNNQYSSIVPINLVTGYRFAYAGVRMGGINGQGYYAKTDGTNSWITYVDTSGAESVLAATGVGFNGFTDVMKISIDGSTIALYKNGVQIGNNVNDTRIASGSPGIQCTPDNNCGLDSWNGGDFIIPKHAFSDNFNRASLGSNWTNAMASAGTINTNAYAASAWNVRSGAIFNYPGLSSTQFSQANVTNLFDGSNHRYAELLVRWTPSGGGSGYMFRTDGSGSANDGDKTSLIKWTNGAITSYMYNFTTTFVDNDVIRLEASGNTLKAYKNGAQIGATVTDSTYATGGVGVGSFDNQNSPAQQTLDDWKGGEY